MSIRPRQVAEEAHRFSLRSVFRTLETQSAPEDAPAPTTTAAAVPTAIAAAPVSPTAPPMVTGTGLHFDLNLPSKPTAPLLALPTSSQGLKFTLPQMRAPQSENGGLPVKNTSVEAGGKMLRAGYIVGGSQGSQNDVMRLNGIVDDLQSKLKKCADRLSTTEQSVARGNAALQSERATSHARMVALAGQVRDAQERETAVRAEMSAMPKVSDYDQQRFAMQAQGALQLEQRYEEEVARAAALEEVLATLRGEQETVATEHSALQVQLEEAKTELEATKAAVELAETNNTSVKREALAMIAEAEAKTDALLAEQAKAAEEVATAAQAGAADMEAMQHALEEATAELKRTQESMEAEVAKSAEADTIIKGMDLKLIDLRNAIREKEEQNLQLAETATATAARAGEAFFEAQQAKAALEASLPTPTDMNASVDTTIVEAFENYYARKQIAERSMGTADAAHNHAVALRAYEALARGVPETPQVFSCCVEATGECDDDTNSDAKTLAAEVFATSMSARQALCAALPAPRLCGTSRDLDCPVDLDAPTDAATTGTPTDTAPLALKMRTEAYVKAVSMDLRRGLIHASRQWISAAGGELPPMPEECAMAGMERAKPAAPPPPTEPPPGET